MQDWLAVTKECMDRNDDAGLLRALALQILETYRRDARLQRVLLFAALEGHEQGLAHFRQTSIPIFAPLGQYIARRQREGKLLDYDAGMIIAAIAGMAANFAAMNHMFGFECGMPDERAADIFTYTKPPAPTVAGISPSSGPIGTLLTITGTGFTGSSARPRRMTSWVS